MQKCPGCGRQIAPPPRAACPFCRRPLTPAGAPDADLEPFPAGPGPGDGPAWERRGELGFGPALLETTRQVITGPVAFFASMSTRGGIGGPLLFGFVVGSLGLILMIAGVLVLGGLLEWAVPSPGTGGPGTGMTLADSVFAFVFYLVAIPPGVVVILFLEAGLTHLLLMMFGGAREPFEATFAVSAYSRAVTLALAIPVAGWLGGAVWLVVVRVIGLREAHRCGGGKAAAAVLLPPIFCCCLQTLVYVAVFGLAALAVLGGAAAS